MAKLNLAIRTPSTYLRAIVQALLRDIEQQVNALSEGRITASYNAFTATPTGTAQAYMQGDYVKNSAPTEKGSSGSKYVVKGWLCVGSGSPGTWVEDRGLTGN